MLSFGETSEVVLAAQKRLKLLGYMTSEPDGNYGNDTVMAVKQFQSRNDQVVDGYLGPSTRLALNSDTAVPNGLRIGDSGDTISKVQNMLSKLGYINAANVTGYYGEVTENAVKLFQRTNNLSVDGGGGRSDHDHADQRKRKKGPRQCTPADHRRLLLKQDPVKGRKQHQNFRRQQCTQHRQCQRQRQFPAFRGKVQAGMPLCVGGKGAQFL